MSRYVYSTLTASQVYTDGEGGEVYIAGGANSPTKHMFTPRGVATKITDQQAEVLNRSSLFKFHQQGGFVEMSAFKKDADKVAREMTPADKSSPDTEERLAQEGKDIPASHSAVEGGQKGGRKGKR